MSSSAVMPELNGVVINAAHRSHTPLIYTFKFWAGVLVALVLAVFITLLMIDKSKRSSLNLDTFINYQNSKTTSPIIMSGMSTNINDILQNKDGKLQLINKDNDSAIGTMYKLIFFENQQTGKALHYSPVDGMVSCKPLQLENRGFQWLYSTKLNKLIPELDANKVLTLSGKSVIAVNYYTQPARLIKTSLSRVDALTALPNSYNWTINCTNNTIMHNTTQFCIENGGDASAANGVAAYPNDNSNNKKWSLIVLGTAK